MANQVTTNGGTFTAIVYEPYSSLPGAGPGVMISVGCDMIISFVVDPKGNDTNSVKLFQLIHPAGEWINDREEFRAANGWSVDAGGFSPWYGTDDTGNPRPQPPIDPENLRVTKQFADYIKKNNVTTMSAFGSKRGVRVQPAWLTDHPRHMKATVGNKIRVPLVTIAYDVQNNAYLGGVEYGFDFAANGVVTTLPFKMAFKAGPQAGSDHAQAVTNWNNQTGNTTIP